MIYYEIIIDGGDGSANVRRFKTLEKAEKYSELELEYSGMGPIEGPYQVDTESADFFDEVPDEEE